VDMICSIVLLLTSSPDRCGIPITACRYTRQHQPLALGIPLCHVTPCHATPRCTTLLSLTTPHPTTLPRLLTNLINDINKSTPDSPSLPSLCHDTSTCDQGTDHFSVFALDGLGRKYIIVPHHLHLAPYPHPGAKQKLFVLKRQAYLQAQTTREERRDRLLLHATFFSPQPGVSTSYYKQLLGLFGGIFFIFGLFSHQQKSQRDHSAYPCCNPTTKSDCGSSRRRSHILETTRKNMIYFPRRRWRQRAFRDDGGFFLFLKLLVFSGQEWRGAISLIFVMNVSSFSCCCAGWFPYCSPAISSLTRLDSMSYNR
jgi:hypothetical protein